MKIRVLFLFIFLLASGVAWAAGAIDGPTRAEIGRTLSRIVAREVSGGGVRVQAIKASRGRVQIYASIGLSY